MNGKDSRVFSAEKGMCVGRGCLTAREATVHSGKAHRQADPMGLTSGLLIAQGCPVAWHAAALPWKLPGPGGGGVWFVPDHLHLPIRV